MPSALTTSPATAARSAVMPLDELASGVGHVKAGVDLLTLGGQVGDGSGRGLGVTLRDGGQPTPLVERQALVPHQRVQPLDLRSASASTLRAWASFASHSASRRSRSSASCDDGALHVERHLLEVVEHSGVDRLARDVGLLALGGTGAASHAAVVLADARRGLVRVGWTAGAAAPAAQQPVRQQEPLRVTTPALAVLAERALDGRPTARGRSAAPSSGTCPPWLTSWPIQIGLREHLRRPSAATPRVASGGAVPGRVQLAGDLASATSRSGHLEHRSTTATSAGRGVRLPEPSPGSNP